MKLPQNFDDPDFDVANLTEEDWRTLRKERRIAEDKLLAIDVDSLTEDEAYAALDWALGELQRVSHWARLAEARRGWTASLEESTCTAADTVEALARHEIDDRRHKRDTTIESNESRKLKWLKDLFDQVYNQYRDENGKPPGWSKLQGLAIRAARGNDRTPEDLEQMTEYRAKAYLTARKNS